MTALAIAVVMVVPVTILLGLLHLMNRREQRRAEVIARQIALTDAIHAVLGPVVAPLVRRGRAGRWIGVLPVRPGQAQLGVMIDIAQAALGPDGEIVLRPSDEIPPPQRRAPIAPALAVSGRFTR